VGDGVEGVETPALLVDLDAFERNCLRLKDG
jgi:D-serine deaminase-like pyridoxal phosphate-dependent protein